MSQKARKSRSMTPGKAQSTHEPKNPEFLGIYAAHRVGALAGMSGYTIGQWARHGLIRPTYYEGRPANLYAFNDVAEAIVIRWLLSKGFTYEQIHHAIDCAHEEYPDWPLLRAPLGVAQHAVKGDPRGVIAQRSDDGTYVDVSHAGGQVTLKPQLFQDVALMLRTGGWIANELGLKRIEVDPGKLGGVPSLKGRRWPVESVAQIAADDEGRTILLNEYGLAKGEVDESVRWVNAVAAIH
jgi:uncharacterized protein (DUF433 family)/DNA-binding transcriptional MerR regulator